MATFVYERDCGGHLGFCTMSLDLDKIYLQKWIPWPPKPTPRHQDHLPSYNNNRDMATFVYEHDYGGHLGFCTMSLDLDKIYLQKWIPWPPKPTPRHQDHPPSYNNNRDMDTSIWSGGHLGYCAILPYGLIIFSGNNKIIKADGLSIPKMYVTFLFWAGAWEPLWPAGL